MEEFYYDALETYHTTSQTTKSMQEEIKLLATYFAEANVERADSQYIFSTVQQFLIFVVKSKDNYFQRKASDNNVNVTSTVSQANSTTKEREESDHRSKNILPTNTKPMIPTINIINDSKVTSPSPEGDQTFDPSSTPTRRSPRPLSRERVGRPITPRIRTSVHNDSLKRETPTEDEEKNLKALNEVLNLKVDTKSYGIQTPLRKGLEERRKLIGPLSPMCSPKSGTPSRSQMNDNEVEELFPLPSSKYTFGK